MTYRDYTIKVTRKLMQTITVSVVSTDEDAAIEAAFDMALDMPTEQWRNLDIDYEAVILEVDDCNLDLDDDS